VDPIAVPRVSRVSFSLSLLRPTLLWLSRPVNISAIVLVVLKSVLPNKRVGIIFGQKHSCFILS
jgi:hypothetical protein